MECLCGESFVHLCWLCEAVADDVAGVLSSLVGEEREEVGLEVFAKRVLDPLFSEDVVEVLELHRRVASWLEWCAAGEREEFAQCLLELRDEDVDGFRVVTVEVGLDPFLSNT